MTDISAEAYICGSLLIDGEPVLKAIRGIVTAEHFGVEAYRAIFTAAATLSEAGEVIDPVSIADTAKRQGVELPRDLMVQLMEVVPTAANCVEYAHRVAEDARTRRIKGLATRIQDDTVSSPDELLATLQRECEAIRCSDYQQGLLNPSDDESPTHFSAWGMRLSKNEHRYSGVGALKAPLVPKGSWQKSIDF